MTAWVTFVSQMIVFSVLFGLSLNLDRVESNMKSKEKRVLVVHFHFKDGYEYQITVTLNTHTQCGTLPAYFSLSDELSYLI